MIAQIIFHSSIAMHRRIVVILALNEMEKGLVSPMENSVTVGSSITLFFVLNFEKIEICLTCQRSLC